LCRYKIETTTAAANRDPAIWKFYDAALAEFSVDENYLLMCLLDRLTAGLAKL